MHRGWIHRRICSLRVTHLQGRKLKRPVTKFRHQTVFSYAYHARANRDFYRCEEDILSEEPLCFWTFYPTVLVLGPIYVNFVSREENIQFDIILKAIEQKTLDIETKTTTAKKKAQKYFQWHSKCHRSLMSILLMRSANGLLKNHKMSQFFFRSTWIQCCILFLSFIDRPNAYMWPKYLLIITQPLHSAH